MRTNDYTRAFYRYELLGAIRGIKSHSVKIAFKRKGKSILDPVHCKEYLLSSMFITNQ